MLGSDFHFFKCSHILGNFILSSLLHLFIFNFLTLLSIWFLTFFRLKSFYIFFKLFLGSIYNILYLSLTFHLTFCNFLNFILNNINFFKKLPQSPFPRSSLFFLIRKACNNSSWHTFFSISVINSIIFVQDFYHLFHIFNGLIHLNTFICVTNNGNQ